MHAFLDGGDMVNCILEPVASSGRGIKQGLFEEFPVDTMVPEEPITNIRRPNNRF